MANINPISVANDIAKSYLTNNPKATPQDLQAVVRNQLQQLKRNGAKISDNKIAQVNAQIADIHKATLEQIKANTVTKATPKAQKAVETLNNTQASTAYKRTHWAADHHYDEFNGLSKKARQNLHKRNMADAKAAFADERFAEPKVETVSNNQAKKEANADYQSAKKQKQAKKQAEAQSQAEHKAQRPIKNKKIRKERNNARYCTSQGIMTRNARKTFKNVSQGLDGSISVTVNDAPNSTLQRMSDYYRQLEAQNPVVQKPVATAPIVKPAAATKPAATKAAETVAEAASKAKGKGGKIGIIAAGLAGLAALIGGADLITSKKSQEALNEVA